MLSFAVRNIKAALEGKSKIENWVGGVVCFFIACGLLFAGCSNNPTNGYEDSNSNPHYPWESDLEQYNENKKPWE